jgi:hypothetical protein
MLISGLFPVRVFVTFSAFIRKEMAPAAERKVPYADDI